MKKTKIVVLGTGFGGIYTFLYLKDYLKRVPQVEVTLVNETNHFLFTPLLHEVATGGVSWANVVQPIREIVENTSTVFHESRVKSIDLNKKIVETEDEDLSYDYLVIALGASTNFYGIEGAKQNCFVLKSLNDAVNLRDHFIKVFEKAWEEPSIEKKKELLTFALIGGGATGVELAAEMHELFFDTFGAFYRNSNLLKYTKVYLIDALPEILPQFHRDLRKKAFSILENKGVIFKLNKPVKKIDSKGVHFKSGKFLHVKNIVWTAGVKPNTPKFLSKIKLDKSDRILINEYLQLDGFNDAFALGDISCLLDRRSGKCLPMMAQVAFSQAKIVANNIINSIENNELKKFKYKPSGYLISIGRWNALGDLMKMRVSGPHIWLLWKFVYLLKLRFFEKRLRVFMDWILALFYPRDISNMN